MVFVGFEKNKNVDKADVTFVYYQGDIWEQICFQKSVDVINEVVQKNDIRSAYPENLDFYATANCIVYPVLPIHLQEVQRNPYNTLKPFEIKNGKCFIGKHEYDVKKQNSNDPVFKLHQLNEEKQQELEALRKKVQGLQECISYKEQKLQEEYKNRAENQGTIRHLEWEKKKLADTLAEKIFFLSESETKVREEYAELQKKQMKR